MEILSRIRDLRNPRVLIPLLSLIIWAFTWIIEAIVEVSLFSNASFLEHLLFGVPSKELYFRILTLVGLLVFSGILGHLLHFTHKTKQEYDGLFRTTQDGILVLDSDGYMLNVNEAASKILGFSKNELPGKHITEIDALDNPTVTRNRIKKLKKEGSLRFETVHRRKDGAVIEVGVTSTYLDQSGGKIISFIRDLSVQKNTVRQLRKSESKFKSLVNSIGDIVYTLDRSHRHTGIYGNWLEDLGLEESDFIGRTARDIFGPEAAKVHEESTNRALQGEYVIYEWDIPADEGTTYYQTSLSPHKIGESIVGVIGVGRNISELKVMAKALEKSEHKFKEIFHNANDAMYLHELTLEGMPGPFLEVNRAASDMLGYTLEEFQTFTPQNIDASDLNESASTIMDTLIREGSVRFEGHHITKDGNHIPVEITTKLFEFDGQARVLSIARNITERKIAEEQLRESEEQFRSMFEKSPVGKELYDAQGRLIAINESCARIYGLEESEEVQGFNLFDDRNLSGELKSRLRSGKSVQYEHWFDFEKVKENHLYKTAKSGKIFLHVEITPVNWHFGSQETGYLVQVQDFTDQKNAESRLIEIKERLELAVSASGIGLWDWNVQTGEVNFNEEWAAMAGYSLEELEPISIDTWIQIAHPDDLEISNKKLQDFWEGESEYYECEIRMRHKSGKWIWVRDRGEVIEWTDDGEPLRMIGTHSEITTAKEKEQKQQHQLARFEEIVNPLDQGIAIMDQTRTITYMNEAAAQVFDTTPEKSVGVHIADLITSQAWNDLKQKYRQQVEPQNGNTPISIPFSTLNGFEGYEELALQIVPIKPEREGTEYLVKIGRSADMILPSNKPLSDTGKEIITLCSTCHKIQTDSEKWIPLENYFKEVWDILTSHGLCSECLQELLQGHNIAQ